MIAQFDARQHRTWIALLSCLILAMICFTDSASGQQNNQQRPAGRRPHPIIPRQINRNDNRKVNPILSAAPSIPQPACPSSSRALPPFSKTAMPKPPTPRPAWP